MQISDLVGQYNNSTQKPQVTGTTGTKKLASTLQEMKAGSIFEGTVNSIKNGQVVLGLSNGQTVTARLDGKVALSVGSSMFFLVKTNEGGTIAIRPYTVGGNSMNLTLMDALKAANLPIDERNLAMVNAMMEEQMSIDRESLTGMFRMVAANPDVDVKSLIQMQKLEIPITPENTSQFQNYMMDKQAITQTLDQFMAEIPDVIAGKDFSGGKMQQMAREILSIVTEGLPDSVDLPSADIASAGAALESVLPAGEALESAAASGAAFTASVEADGVVPETNPKTAEQAETTQLSSAEENPDSAEEILPQNDSNAQPKAENLMARGADSIKSEIPFTLGNVLNREQIQSLENLFSEIMPKNDDGEHTQMTFSGNDSTVAVLNALLERLSGGESIEKDTLTRLFSGKEFHALVKDALEQQWLLKPEDLKDSSKINRLYEKLENQMERIENVVKASGQESANVTQLAQNIRSNVEFMNQINEAYTYVQIPLKLSGQSASGELYVYTNKKKLAEGADELSAFLHLDMDHLGSTDVSVKLRGRQADTRFYFDNDEAYNLVEANIGKLEARLNAKGYNCKITVVNEGKHVNFVEDFLKKDQPSAGLVHRYSFDVRA